MDKSTRIFSHDPLTLVEYILAVFGVITGILVLTIPIAAFGVGVNTAPTIAIESINSNWAILTLGIVGIVMSIANIVAIHKRHLVIRSITLFMQILVRIYSTLATILVWGFYPVVIISPIALLFVAVVCYVTVRKKINFLREVKR